MTNTSRRSFLGASLAAFSSIPAFGQEKLTEPLVKVPEDPAFQPATLFLTWQRNPTTTMTIQWTGAIGETSDTSISYAPLKGIIWQKQETQTKPYAPKTDLKVFRAELTDLSPGTDYLFRIGKYSPTYRFRTMPAKATDTISFISGGDCGINSHALANNIQAARQDPMFAVVGGDLGYDNGRSIE